MPTIFTIEADPTFRDWKGRFARATDELLTSRRDMVRNMGKKYVEAARRHAPGTNFPKTIGYQTYQGTNEIGMRVFAQQPLHTYIVEGTKPHRIPKSGNKLLAFHWEKGPQGAGMYYFFHVQHPGTKKNPYHLRAWDDVEPEIDKELRRISTRMFNTLKG